MMKRHSKCARKGRRTSVRQIDGRKFILRCSLKRNKHSSFHTPWIVSTHDERYGVVKMHFATRRDAIWASHGG